MLARLCFVLLLLRCVPAWCQADTSNSSSGNGTDASMQVPPPVSGQGYPTTFAGDTASNYWKAGFTLTSAYTSNVTGGSSPVGAMNYSFWPTIGLSKATSQLQLGLNYSPGFTLYQHVNGYNQADQNFNINLQYRTSPRLTFSLQDAFLKTSNLFAQPNPLAATPVSGAAPVSGATVIAPLGDQISNLTAVQATYQVNATGMVGASGTFSTLYYPNPGQVSGLYNSRSAGGSLFYSRQLGEKYYTGVTYQYQQILSSQTDMIGSRTQIQTFSGFLSIYFRPTLSVSISGGTQYSTATQLPFPPSTSWTPTLTVSAGWQGQRTTLAASYSHLVSGGGGLNGAFHSETAATSANWRMTRYWNAGIAATYADNTSLTPFFLSSSGGRTIAGSLSAQRALGEHFNVQFGYSWTHQVYEEIAVISAAPNVSRVFISINYQVTKPLQK